MRMILLYYNCTFALFIFRLHKLGIEAHAYAHYTSLLCFALLWIPWSRVAYLGPDPGPVKPAICPVTAIAFIKALTARVAGLPTPCRHIQTDVTCV